MNVTTGEFLQPPRIPSIEREKVRFKRSQQQENNHKSYRSIQDNNNQDHRQLSLEDVANDNYWSTSLYSQPPVLTSARCVEALREFFATPSVLAVATESSSHPTGLQSVLAQPWLYAGGGLGNIEECPLQVCLAGAGTRRDSITFASVCVPFECHAQDLAADDFPASLELAAEPTLELVNNPDDDDNPFEYANHPERPHHNNENIHDTAWFHTSPEEQRDWAQEYITLQTRIAKLNRFLQTGWTCGNYQVPFEPFPLGIPYLVVCASVLLLTLWGTCGIDNRQQSSQQRRAEPSQQQQPEPTQTTPTVDALPCMKTSEGIKCSSGSLVTPSCPTQDTQSLASLSSRAPSEPSPAPLWPGQDALQVEGARQTEAESASPTPPPTTLKACWNASYHWHKLCTSRHEATACLDGLRVWSILWVILGHVMAIESSTGGGYSNPVDFLPPSGVTTSVLGQLIFASRFAVDTFLVISGYLLVTVIVRKAPTLLAHTRQHEPRQIVTGARGWSCAGGGRKLVIFFQLIGLRLLRILPLYLLCMGFFTQVAPHLYLVGEENEGGGPFWYQWDSLLQPCRDYGWTNLLFINNFLPLGKSNTETCFYHSWYLAVDMQLFVLFGLPVTLFIFLRSPKWGKRVTLTLWWTSVLLTAYLAYARHWSINTFDGLQVARFDVEGYAKPHVRGQAYFAGMYVAMLQLTKTGTAASSQRTWKHRAMLWTSILALGFVTFCTETGAYARRPCQYGEAPILNDCGSLWNPTATFLYTASSRAIWSCSIGMLMTLCLEGRGGWLNRFLSWPIWAPLAQLSFGTYLIHPIVIFVWLLGMRQKNVYSLATFGMSLTSVCFVSFVWALVSALLVEFPVATLIARSIKNKTTPKPRPAIGNVDGGALSEQMASSGFELGPSEETRELLSVRRLSRGHYGTSL